MSEYEFAVYLSGFGAMAKFGAGTILVAVAVTVVVLGVVSASAVLAVDRLAGRRRADA
jgi:hypothetical protein